MPLIPLDIPAGIYRNGTELQASGAGVMLT